MAAPRIRPALRACALVAVVASLTAAGLAGCSTGRGTAVTQGDTFQFVSPGGQTTIRYPVAERRPLAPLSGPSVLNPEEQINLADYAGQVVAINLWGRWCAPCRSEVDDLQRLQDANQDQGFTVLGINLRDTNRQNPEDFMRANEVTFPSIWDPSQAAVAALRGFPTSVVPSTLLLDRQHRVAAVFLTEISDVKLQPVISELLAEEPAPASVTAQQQKTAGPQPTKPQPRQEANRPTHQRPAQSPVRP